MSRLAQQDTSETLTLTHATAAIQHVVLVPEVLSLNVEAVMTDTF